MLTGLTVQIFIIFTDEPQLQIYTVYILYLQRTEPPWSYNEKVQLKKIITDFEYK